MAKIDIRVLWAKRYPLHAAIDRCNFPEVQRFLTEDLEFHIGRKVMKIEVGVLHSACSLRKLENENSSTSFTAKERIFEIAKYLIERGASEFEVDSVGQVPLHYAVANPFSESLVPLLLQSSSTHSVNVTRSLDGWSPLHIAAMFGKTSEILSLLDKGGDPGLLDTEGRSPIDIAVFYHQRNAAALLKSPRKEFEFSVSPLAFALVFGKMTTIKCILENETNRLDFEKAENPKGQTLLHLSFLYFPLLDPESLLFRKEVTKKSFNAQDENGNTPLMSLIIERQFDLTRRILRSETFETKGLLNPSLLNHKGQNLLELLIISGDTHNFSYLLQKEKPSWNLSFFIQTLKNFSSESFLRSVLRLSGNGKVILCQAFSQNEFEFVDRLLKFHSSELQIYNTYQKLSQDKYESPLFGFFNENLSLSTLDLLLTHVYFEFVAQTNELIYILDSNLDSSSSFLSLCPRIQILLAHKSFPHIHELILRGQSLLTHVVHFSKEIKRKTQSQEDTDENKEMIQVYKEIQKSLLDLEKEAHNESFSSTVLCLESQGILGEKELLTDLWNSLTTKSRKDIGVQTVNFLDGSFIL